MPKGFHKRDQRDPFTVERLTRLFAAPIFTGCATPGRPYTPGDYRIRDHRYWVPLVALFSGARANELGQMEIADVLQRAGIWCLHITTQSDHDDPEDEKHIKTSAGRRLVPVHPELVRLGFLEYVEERRVAGDRRVFPDWNKGADETYSSIFGKFFNDRLLKKLGIKTRKIVFHSLRHSFMDAMRDAGIQDAIKKAIIGHADASVTALYGSGEPIRRLYDAVRRINYEGLDLSHLYAVSVAPRSVSERTDAKRSCETESVA